MRNARIGTPWKQLADQTLNGAYAGITERVWTALSPRPMDALRIPLRDEIRDHIEFLEGEVRWIMGG